MGWIRQSPTFKLLNIYTLTNKVLPSGIIQKKFLLNGKAFGMHLGKFALPLAESLGFCLLKPISINFFLG
jgi:hypothetical protein